MVINEAMVELAHDQPSNGPLRHKAAPDRSKQHCKAKMKRRCTKGRTANTSDPEFTAIVCVLELANEHQGKGSPYFEYNDQMRVSCN